MMKRLFTQGLLITLFGSVMFLLSCTDDEGTILEVTAAFTFETTEGSGQVVFQNNSVNADDYVWVFDDGNTSTAENPTHTYAASGSYDVTLTASNDTDDDSNTQQVTVTITTSPTDTEAPVITLVGADPLCLTVGDAYMDPGATATDNVDDDATLTDAIVVGGDNVDTSTAGEYTVTYDVVDAGNNAATQVERIVIVSAAFSIEDNLVDNADFSNTVIADNPWYANYENGPEIRTEGCSSFFFAEIAAGESNEMSPFVVNISQVIDDAAPNKSYELSFNASSDRNRTIIAGIGLTGGASGENFQNTSETVAITDTDNRYTVLLNTNGFEAEADIRVLFDLAGAEGTVVIDNVALVEVETVAVPPTAAPTAPTQDAADVISIYSDSYTDVTIGGGLNTIGAATFAEVDLSGNSVLQYTQASVELGNFSIIDLGDANQLDLATAGMTNFRFDAWFPNAVGAGASFILKIANLDGETDEGTITITTASSPALAQGAWLSYDFSLAELATLGLTSNSNVQQVVIDVINVGEVYLDNIYFYAGDDTGASNGCDSDLVAATSLPLDFEGCSTFLPFPDTGNGGLFGGGITAELTENPDKTGINTSDFALRIDKAAGANFFSGIQNAFANPLDFTSDVLKVKLYSTKANVDFTFEMILNPNPNMEGNPTPTTVTVTDANVWTEFEVAFGGFPLNPDDYNQLVIKPDNDVADADGFIDVGGTYYIDDIEIGPPAATGTPGVYCDTQIKHFGGNAGSEALLTIESVTRGDGFPALKFTVRADPTNGKTPEFITVNSFEGANGLEPLDTSVEGEVSIQAFWPDASNVPPNDETTFNVLWRFEGEAAQWQLFETVADVRVPLDATCAE